METQAKNIESTILKLFSVFNGKTRNAIANKLYKFHQSRENDAQKLGKN